MWNAESKMRNRKCGMTLIGKMRNAQNANNETTMHCWPDAVTHTLLKIDVVTHILLKIDVGIRYTSGATRGLGSVVTHPTQRGPGGIPVEIWFWYFWVWKKSCCDNQFIIFATFATHKIWFYLKFWSRAFNPSEFYPCDNSWITLLDEVKSSSWTQTQVIWLGLRRQLDIAISGIQLMLTTVPLFSTVLRVDMDGRHHWRQPDHVSARQYRLSVSVLPVTPSSVDRISVLLIVCVSWPLDYCNGLLYGVADSQLRRLSLL